LLALYNIVLFALYNIVLLALYNILKLPTEDGNLTNSFRVKKISW
jgi:hypothetical protein